MPHVTVHVDPSLRPLLPRQDRANADVTRDAAPTETVAHLLQILGLPVTEVEAASVDGTRIEHNALRTTHLRNASAVTVEARHRPQPNSSRFLLDVHLGALARRMRLLGIDTAYDPDLDDAQLASHTAIERRELLTRDRGLLFRRAVHDGALIRSDDVDAQLDEVLSRFAPPLAPWTRCLLCGALLAEVPPAAVADRLEPGTRHTYRSFSQCTACEQVYWRGARPVFASIHSGSISPPAYIRLITGIVPVERSAAHDLQCTDHPRPGHVAPIRFPPRSGPPVRPGDNPRSDWNNEKEFTQ